MLEKAYLKQILIICGYRVPYHILREKQQHILGELPGTFFAFCTYHLSLLEEEICMIMLSKNIPLKTKIKQRTSVLLRNLI